MAQKLFAACLKLTGICCFVLSDITDRSQVLLYQVVRGILFLQSRYEFQWN